MIEVTIYKQAKEENLATLGVDRMEINNMDRGVISRGICVKVQETKTQECTSVKSSEENCTVKRRIKTCEESLKTTSIKFKVQEANKRLSRKSNSMHKKSWSEYSARYKRKQKADCHRHL